MTDPSWHRIRPSRLRVGGMVFSLVVTALFLASRGTPTFVAAMALVLAMILAAGLLRTEVRSDGSVIVGRALFGPTVEQPIAAARISARTLGFGGESDHFTIEGGGQQFALPLLIFTVADQSLLRRLAGGRQAD